MFTRTSHDDGGGNTKWLFSFVTEQEETPIKEHATRL